MNHKPPFRCLARPSNLGLPLYFNSGIRAEFEDYRFNCTRSTHLHCSPCSPYTNNFNLTHRLIILIATNQTDLGTGPNFLRLWRYLLRMMLFMQTSLLLSLNHLLAAIFWHVFNHPDVFNHPGVFNHSGKLFNLDSKIFHYSLKLSHGFLQAFILIKRTQKDTFRCWHSMEAMIWKSSTTSVKPSLA